MVRDVLELMGLAPIPYDVVIVLQFTFSVPIIADFILNGKDAQAVSEFFVLRNSVFYTCADVLVIFRPVDLALHVLLFRVQVGLKTPA